MLFGYAYISASAVPEIVEEGKKLVEQTQAFVSDVPNIELPTFNLEHKDATPILSILSRPAADELRSALADFLDDSVSIEKLPGLAVSAFLLEEGASSEPPPLGGVLADHAGFLGRPGAELISEEEFRQRIFHPPDIVTQNQLIGEPEIAFLLDLRQRVGPIGAHLDQLYRGRRIAELMQLTAEVDRRRLSPLTDFMNEAMYRHMLLGRLTSFLGLADAPIFVALPIKVLPGPGGILSLLRARGSTLTPVF